MVLPIALRIFTIVVIKNHVIGKLIFLFKIIDSFLFFFIFKIQNLIEFD